MGGLFRINNDMPCPHFKNSIFYDFITFKVKYIGITTDTIVFQSDTDLYFLTRDTGENLKCVYYPSNKTIELYDLFNFVVGKDIKISFCFNRIFCEIFSDDLKAGELYYAQIDKE